MNSLALTLAFVGLILIIQGGYDAELRRERDRADRLRDGLRRERAAAGAVDLASPRWPGGMVGWPWTAAEAGAGGAQEGQGSIGSHSGSALFADETAWKFRDSVDLPARGDGQAGAAEETAWKLGLAAGQAAEGFTGEARAAPRSRRREKLMAGRGTPPHRNIPTTGPLRPPSPPEPRNF